MIYQLAVIASLASGAAAASTVYTSDPDAQINLFQEFQREYNKLYKHDEEPIRFKNFLSNLKLIDERNAAESGSAVHGITKFSDLSQDEFRSKFLQSQSSSSKSSTSSARNIMEHVPNTYNGTASLVDWTGVYTTPVKDQGYCGSCWAFSATEQLESDAMRVLGSSYILSAEQTTQCTNYVIGGGCGGGFTESAYNYIKKEGGLVQDSDYPYTMTTYQGVTGACEVDSSLDVISLTSFTTIKGESNMASYVQSTGPLSVCVAAEVWNTYKGGIMSTCPGGVDHCVQAVGVDTGVNGYWKVRNSWGTKWGESGFIRLSYGSNTCMIDDDPTWVVPVKA